MKTEKVSSHSNWYIEVLQSVLPAAFTVVLCFLATFQIAVPALRDNMESLKKEELRSLTDTVWQLLSNYNSRVLTGELSLEEAQNRAKERVRHLRYGPGGRNYFWINDLMPKVVVLPYRSDLEGEDVSKFQDRSGKYLFVDIVKLAKTDGFGFLEHLWHWHDDLERVEEKISYLKLYDPWGWVIGTGIYVGEMKAEIKKTIDKLNIAFILIFVGIVLLTLHRIWYIRRIERSRAIAVREREKLQAFLSSIIDSMPSALISLDTDYQVTQWNGEAERMTGVAPDKALGEKLEEVFPDFPMATEILEAAVEERASDKERVSWHNGSRQCFLDIAVFPLILNDEGGVVIRLDDVTDKVNIEEMMIQSEKMASVGGLAAGMAHEINNPLAVILQNGQVIEGRLAAGVKKNEEVARSVGTTLSAVSTYLRRQGVIRMLEATREAGVRAARIVEGMLSFSRRSLDESGVHDICDILDKTIELASTDYDLKKKYDFRDISIRRDYGEDVPSIYCERTKIQQVFLNILKNSAQAMAEGDSSRKSELFLKISLEGRKVVIKIRDNGPGIEERIRRRIFEPFFTTKEVGQGSGLGLFVSYFIITEAHKGSLTVESQVGEGTEFIITLPITHS